MPKVLCLASLELLAFSYDSDHFVLVKSTDNDTYPPSFRLLRNCT